MFQCTTKSDVIVCMDMCAMTVACPHMSCGRSSIKRSNHWKQALIMSYALWFLISIQSSDYDATTLAKVSLFSA